MRARDQRGSSMYGEKRSCRRVRVSRSSLPAIHSIESSPCYPSLLKSAVCCILLLDTTLHDLFHSRQHQRHPHDQGDHARFHPPLLFDFPAYLTIPAAAQNGTVSPRAPPPLSTTTPTTHELRPSDYRHCRRRAETPPLPQPLLSNTKPRAAHHSTANVE